jgi:hypothetical protein
MARTLGDRRDETDCPLKALFIETSQTLKGHERRLFIAKVVRL